MITARDLKLAALKWLVYERSNVAAVSERHFRGGLGDPDVIGITSARCITEVEIKVTMSDFYANSHKRHVISRDWNIARWPKFYYFMVLPSMVEQCLEEMPVWSGLLTVDPELMPQLTYKTNVVKVVSRAPENKFAKRATMRECAKLTRCLTNHVISTESKFLRTCKLLADKRELEKP